jgi:group I intron endonuclease
VLIYLITNRVNGKQYVGQTVGSVQARFKKHLWPSTSTFTNMPIAGAVKKYGRENFTVGVLCECASQEEMDRMERHYAVTLQTFVPNGYNLRAGNGRGTMSAELKRRIGDGRRGKLASPETRRRLSLAHIGHTWSDATREKQSALRRGIPASPACYEAASRSNARTHTLVSPSGELVTITNMRKFCAKNAMSAPKMCEVVRGHRAQYKGWRKL